MRKEPYKVIVWGPGVLGGAGLREILKRPEFELVGVLAYSDSKHGKDAAELIGLPACGVKATTDKEEIYAMDADCVIHTPGAPGVDTSEMDGEVIRLLESGKNVISSVAYHFPSQRGDDFVAQLEAACKKGNASLHGSGIHPSYLVERLAITLTGLTNDIEYMHVEEFADNSGEANSEVILSTAGFGQPPSYFDDGNPIWDIAGRYYRESLDAAAEMLWGKTFDRIETRFTPIYAETDMQIGICNIAKGNCLTVIHSYDGYMGKKKKMTITEYWYLGRENCPAPGVDSDTHHRILIEGDPCSMQMSMDTKASILNNQDTTEANKTPSIYNATIVPMIQTIPVVCAADPGIVYQSVFSHYADDFRRLGK